MHMVTPHVPEIIGLVYSLPHVLVHLHDCKQSNFRTEDSGHKFGALGLGKSSWAKSVAMQVYQTGGKNGKPTAMFAQNHVRAVSSSICKWQG